MDTQTQPSLNGRIIIVTRGGSGHPIGRWGKRHEIAEAATWLLSDAASFVTGTVLSINGGYTAT